MDQTVALPLDPLPYHQAVIRYLREHEPALWNWFSAGRLRAEQNDAVRLDLLKSTYRLDRDVHYSLYEAADEVAARFGLRAPVTFYQCQSAVGLNASLHYLPGEAHVVLTGPVTGTLSALELRGVLGHEILHFLLLERWPEYLTASQLLTAMTNDVSAESAHLATARFFDLYAEIYCDRGAYLASGDVGATVSSLVKVQTGTAEVSAESYLRQAEEIFARGLLRAEGVTHPETFIRARAVKLWAEDPERAAAKIAEVIEGPLSLEHLDLPGQLRVTSLTRRLIAALLRHRWLWTDAVLAHARLFFEDFEPGAGVDPGLAADLQSGDQHLRDYFCYVLLDFAASDPDLEEAPLAATLLLCDELGLGERFRQLAAKELNLRKKALDSLEAKAEKVVARAAALEKEEKEEQQR